MKFEEKIATTDGTMFKKVITEVPMEPSNSKKDRIRLKIQDEVFDLNDSVADNAKMLSLLTGIVSRMYDIMPTEQKDLIEAEYRAAMEYSLHKFAATTTRGDVQFAEDGVAAIDKLLSRQQKISDILNGAQ